MLLSLILLGGRMWLLIERVFLRIVLVIMVAAIARSMGFAEGPNQVTPLMRDFMGINGHFAFRPELYRPVCGLVRNYHPTVWDLADDTSRLPDYPLAKNRVNWVDLYGGWKRDGFRTDACLQYESIKLPEWKNLEADIYAYGKAFAAAFGPSSRDLVESAEIGNEPADWDTAAYRKVFENMARGLRAGDPKLKIAGCASDAIAPDQYSKAASVFQGLEDLYDVLNIHTYSMFEGYPTWRRVWPEHVGIRYLKVVTDMLAYRDAHAPGKQVWVTEFGYDAGTKKPGLGDFARWVSSTETEQAQWIVRSYLIFSSLGLNRAYLYYFNDSDEPRLHGSSGITRNFEPKPAYYAMAHLYKTLGDYRFSRVVREEKDDLYLFEYVNPEKPGQPVWVIWSPTGTQRVAVKRIAIPGRLVKAEAMPLRAGGPEKANFQMADGVLELHVTESPVYLWLDRRP